MDTRLRRAGKPDYFLIRNLVPYYVYDMSGDMGWSPNAEGRYDGCDGLAEYWEKPGHDPYIITVDGMVGGFALVRPYPSDPARTEIGEFFVLRKYQGHGVGGASALWLFDAYPGKWLVRVLDANTRARRFWEKVIAGYTLGRFARKAEQHHSPYSGTWPMQFYRFESPPRKDQ